MSEEGLEGVFYGLDEEEGLVPDLVLFVGQEGVEQLEYLGGVGRLGESHLA